MRLHIFLLGITAALAISILSSCGVSARIDWNGKTGVDNQTVTPEFRGVGLENPFTTGSKIEGVSRR